jgi:hypothetical protein
MHDLLRRDLGFRGTVLTDSLEMVGAGGGGAATARLAVEAGADLVIGPDIGVPRGSGTAPLRDVAGCAGKAGQLAREIAHAAVSWLACQSVPPNELFPVVLRVIPDRWGRTEWAAPLVASLQARGCTNVEGRRLIVSAASSSPEAVLEAMEIARAEAPRTEPVVVACGAIDVARRATGRARVVFIGDATAASQEAVVMLLTNEISHRGSPDLPTSPSPLHGGGASSTGRGA